jgi:PAS domain S-box-containing protein
VLKVPKFKASFFDNTINVIYLSLRGSMKNNEVQLQLELIDTAGGELSKVADDTSTKITKQISYINQSSSEFSKVQEDLKLIKESMGEIDHIFNTISNDSEDNSKRISQVTEAMTVLEESFDNILSEAKIINGIAEQTNLLALNATIEAARAGDSGKGFAVVANEVKELSKVTRTTNDNIQDMVNEVTSSIKLLSEKLLTTNTSIKESNTKVSKSRSNINQVIDNTNNFGTVIEQSLLSFNDLLNFTTDVSSQVGELNTIGNTFSYLLTMMSKSGIFTGAGNPVEKLAPLVEQSTDDFSERFSGNAKETVLNQNDVLISATDPKGKITFANKMFYQIAEYEYGELLGKPHNCIRHPDMPKTAFADLWSTIASGNFWTGIVKNKTKSGGYYWVKAMVFPCYSGNDITGYISVRKKPTDDEVESAINAYQKLP